MKHLFFDLDRTLWDFEKNSETALSILYDDLKLGDHLRSFRSFHTKYKKINGELWDQYSKGKISKDILRVKRFQDTLAHFEVKSTELSHALADGYISLSPHQTHLFPDAIETLEQLKNDDFELHIITNGFLEVQHIKLDKSGLKPYFDVILCSEEVGKNKPSRLVFDRALDLAKAKHDESIMIGDSYEADIVGAENAGIRAILFDPDRVHRDGRHKWHIHELKQIPDTLPWM
ncbi:MAG: noncanonical pyrimidine nucleotidase, YjjG family [Flavobacteriales bacterium]|nr:noncanonical pyrimidine nucleotidase, YjjG family [Flavobacteriales bacterium]